MCHFSQKCRTQKEAKESAKSSEDAPPSSFSRHDMENFSMSAVYGELLKSNPTLMTVLFAAASKQKLSSIQVGSYIYKHLFRPYTIHNKQTVSITLAPTLLTTHNTLQHIH